jgi:hypothetical protein
MVVILVLGFLLIADSSGSACMQIYGAGYPWGQIHRAEKKIVTEFLSSEVLSAVPGGLEASNRASPKMTLET